MPANSIESHIKAHYPNALPVTAFRRQAFGALEREFGVPLAQVLLATSICADDIVWVSDVDGNMETQHVTHELLGPFEMGGLAGLPFTGLTGMMAYAHHIPDEGAACIVYGPHIGITATGKLGMVLRPGQHVEFDGMRCVGVGAAAFSVLTRVRAGAGRGRCPGDAVGIASAALSHAISFG